MTESVALPRNQDLLASRQAYLENIELKHQKSLPNATYVFNRAPTTSEDSPAFPETPLDTEVYDLYTQNNEKDQPSTHSQSSSEGNSIQDIDSDTSLDDKGLGMVVHTEEVAPVEKMPTQKWPKVLSLENIDLLSLHKKPMTVYRPNVNDSPSASKGQNRPGPGLLVRPTTTKTVKSVVVKILKAKETTQSLKSLENSGKKVEQSPEMVLLNEIKEESGGKVKTNVSKDLAIFLKKQNTIRTQADRVPLKLQEVFQHAKKRAKKRVGRSKAKRAELMMCYQPAMIKTQEVKPKAKTECSPKKERKQEEKQKEKEKEKKPKLFKTIHIAKETGEIRHVTSLRDVKEQVISEKVAAVKGPEKLEKTEKRESMKSTQVAELKAMSRELSKRTQSRRDPIMHLDIQKVQWNGGVDEKKERRDSIRKSIEKTFDMARSVSPKLQTVKDKKIVEEPKDEDLDVSLFTDPKTLEGKEPGNFVPLKERVKLKVFVKSIIAEHESREKRLQTRSRAGGARGR